MQSGWDFSRSTQGAAARQCCTTIHKLLTCNDISIPGSVGLPPIYVLTRVYIRTALKKDGIRSERRQGCRAEASRVPLPRRLASGLLGRLAVDQRARGGGGVDERRHDYLNKDVGFIH
jgi:hypothetical protein